MKSIICTLALIATPTTFAATTNIWEGSGTLFDVQGHQTGSYNLVVENTETGNQIQSHVTVTLADGTVRKQQCLMTETAKDTWKSSCDHGKGGGHCFGEGLCISYEDDSTGKAYATTIVMDGPSDMRLLRTELQNGQALQFYREKLHKR